MAKLVTFYKDFKEIALKAITVLEQAVGTTMGPSGKMVLLEQPYGAPKMTKDGVTVAKSIEFKDPVENCVASFFKTAATHTVDQAGDGTTTSIVLASNIFKSSLKAVSAGANAVLVKRGIHCAAQIIDKELASLKEEIKGDYNKIKQVATLSANGDEKIGELVADAYEKVGGDGLVNVEVGKTRDHELKIVEGVQFDRGYISSYFATNTEKMIAELENPLILIYDKKISSAQSLVPILKQVHESSKSLFIIAEDIDGEAISTIIVNKLRGVLQVVAVKAPGFGERQKELCKDIAISTGATVVSEEAGYKLENVTLADLGSARKIIVTANETTIIEGSGEKSKVQARIAQIRNQIADASSEYDKEKLEERLAKFAGGIALIKVGGVTEEAAKECKDRVDDAVQAVKAALEEGIVPGGTTALLNSRRALYDQINKSDIRSDERIGMDAVYNAIESLLSQILQNAGRKDLAVVLEHINEAHKNGKKNFGLDVRENKYGDMIELGVMDPVKVVRCALQNAASTASMLLVSDVSITELPKEDKEPAMPGGMPGMGY
jgi:chaperonin GroEL